MEYNKVSEMSQSYQILLSQVGLPRHTGDPFGLSGRGTANIELVGLVFEELGVAELPLQRLLLVEPCPELGVGAKKKGRGRGKTKSCRCTTPWSPRG